ncbi:RsmB/NOP family class I SAM-dependent RNA methyltransferase [Candidatus Geothermarchaeota archaeon]|nr:MAG: RsmB/NOP family class I SAM-dependent RNA methyltransferase [Candidatus Geothermarchaeota archaeon]
MDFGSKKWEVDLTCYERYRRIVPDYDKFLEYLRRPLPYSIRVNTLKISPERLIKRLEKRGFKLEPVKWNPWFYVIREIGGIGQPGKTLEHALGYYYVQELVSALPPIVLDPQPGEQVLDMAAAPGSKTTQMAQLMENKGLIVANDVDIERIRALKSNIDRLGVLNVVITKMDGRRFFSRRIFDKILIDAPCSSEGIVRKDPSAPTKISMKERVKLSRLQKGLVSRAYRLLKKEGTLVYSVCTFSPEECEEVVDHAIRIGFEPIEVKLPIRGIKGVRKWVDERGRTHEYDKGVEKSVRIYPHLNDTGGMFIAKLKKI